MCEETPLDASSGAGNFHLSQDRQLSDRITYLRELIVVMVAQDKDTRRHSEELFKMLRELRAAKLTNVLQASANALQDKRGEPAQPQLTDSKR